MSLARYITSLYHPYTHEGQPQYREFHGWLTSEVTSSFEGHHKRCFVKARLGFVSGALCLFNRIASLIFLPKLISGPFNYNQWGKLTLSCGPKKLLKPAEILSSSVWKVIMMAPFSTELSKV